MIYKGTEEQFSVCFISVHHWEEAWSLIGRRGTLKAAQGHSLPSVWFFDSSQLSLFYVFLRIPLQDKRQNMTLPGHLGVKKVPSGTFWHWLLLWKLTGLLPACVRRSQIFHVRSIISHLDCGSTRPAAIVGTACVYLFIPATAPAISRFPSAPSRHMTQQPPSTLLACERCLPASQQASSYPVSHQPDWSAHLVLARANFIFWSGGAEICNNGRASPGGQIGSGSWWSDGGG